MGELIWTLTRIDPATLCNLDTHLVRHEVARLFIKELDLMFSHQSPIGTCAGGNPGVRSSRDNPPCQYELRHLPPRDQ